MSARATARLAVGALALDIDLTIDDGEVVALLGPNGAGKSTVLRCFAGLRDIDAGSIEIGGAVVDEPIRRIHVPPQRRKVGMAFQDYALFPSLTVLENVAFGLRATGRPRQEARRIAAAWLQRMGLEQHARSRPAALSGGQAQRVALARALAPEPQLLLLDEPLAALDASTRASVRRELAGHLDEFTGPTLLVTHDPVDAAALATRVVVIDAGRIVQSGSLTDILARPRSRYVADLAGANLVSGTVANGVMRTDNDTQVVIADAPDGLMWALIHPHSVMLSRGTSAAPGGAASTSARNSWAGTIESLHRLGDRVRVQIDGDLPLTAEVTAASVDELALDLGRPVIASVKATDIEVYPA